PVGDADTGFDGLRRGAEEREHARRERGGRALEGGDAPLQGLDFLIAGGRGGRLLHRGSGRRRASWTKGVHPPRTTSQVDASRPAHGASLLPPHWTIGAPSDRRRRGRALPRRLAAAAL